jgi:hypothetical protein
VSDSEPQSLIVSEQENSARQLSFFSDEECYELIESATGGHEFTGERLFARHPAKYQLCVRMIAEGLAHRQIARALQISTNTVVAVREREKIPVESLKQGLLTDVRNAAKLCVERVIELAPAMTGRDAAIASGIMIEKMQLLSGEATHITEHKEERIRHADWNQLIDSLPLANAREVLMKCDGNHGEPACADPECWLKGANGFLGESAEQKAGDPSAAGPAQDLGADGSHLDPVSDTLLCKTASSNTLRNEIPPNSPEIAPEREGGRGGSASTAPPGGSD